MSKKTKYFIIDLWNGEGYSNPKVTAKWFEDDLQALAYCEKSAHDSFCKDMYKDSYMVTRLPDGYQYTLYEAGSTDNYDAGKYCFVRADGVIGIACQPTICTYEVIRSVQTFEAWKDTIRKCDAYQEALEVYNEGIEECDVPSLFEYWDCAVAGDIDTQLFDTSLQNCLQCNSPLEDEYTDTDGVEFEEYVCSNHKCQALHTIEIYREDDEFGCPEIDRVWESRKIIEQRSNDYQSRLIASAPKLLEALKRVEECLDNQFQTKDELIPGWIVEAYDVIEDAVIKAEGGAK